MTYGPDLCAARKNAGLSQKSLAALAHVSVKHMCNIERGHAVPSVDVARRIYDALARPSLDAPVRRMANSLAELEKYHCPACRRKKPARCGGVRVIKEGGQAKVACVNFQRRKK